MPKKKEGTSVKKKAVSKRAKSKTAVSIAPQEHEFVTLDGKRLKSIVELAHELDQMADHVFYHHVTQDRNDFANWIKDVFHEAELARQVALTNDKHHTHVIVLRHIVNTMPEDN